MSDIYTPDGLPIVTDRLIKTFIIKHANSKNEQYELFSKELENMHCENSQLFILLGGLAERSYRIQKDCLNEGNIRDVVVNNFLVGAIICYACLRRQADANKLEENLER